MKQRGFTFMLSMLMSMMGVESFAYDAKVDGIYYNFSGKEATVTYLSDYYASNSNAYSGNVIIPETVIYNGTTYSVTSIGEYAFQYCTNLANIIIPNSIITIGGWAFHWCDALKKVTIGNSVTIIGEGAFAGCSSLTDVIFGNSLTTLEQQAFSGCKALKSIVIPESVKSICWKAFDRCWNLASITFPNSIIHIERAFDNTAWLNNQPDGLIYIGNIAYQYKGTMPSNTSIVLKEGTREIVQSAFESCKGLTSITITIPYNVVLL